MRSQDVDVILLEGRLELALKSALFYYKAGQFDVKEDVPIEEQIFNRATEIYSDIINDNLNDMIDDFQRYLKEYEELKNDSGWIITWLGIWQCYYDIKNGKDAGGKKR